MDRVCRKDFINVARHEIKYRFNNSKYVKQGFRMEENMMEQMYVMIRIVVRLGLQKKQDLKDGMKIREKNTGIK